MLGLTSHEPHFSLLREEVRFGGKKAQKRYVWHYFHCVKLKVYCVPYEFFWSVG